MSFTPVNLPENWHWVNIDECLTLRVELFRKRIVTDSGYLLYSPEALESERGPVEASASMIPDSAVVIERGDILWSLDHVWTVNEPSDLRRLATRTLLPLAVTVKGQKEFTPTF